MGERLYIGSCAGKFHALDRRSGRILWTYDIHQDGEQTSFHGDPLVTDELVVISADNTFNSSGIGHIYAFEQSTGRVHWKYRCKDGIPSDIARSGRYVYAVTLADELICLDLRDGRLIWRLSSGAENTKGENGQYSRPTSPTAAGKRILFGGLNGTLYALDSSSGETVWERRLGRRVTTTPLVLDDRVYAGTSEDDMFCLDLKTGREVTHLNLPAPPRGRLLEANGSLLAYLGSDIFAALDTSLERVRWSYRTSGRWSSHLPLIREDLVLIGSSDGRIVALDLVGGTVRWIRVFSGEEVRSVANSDEEFYVGTRRGFLYAWRP